MLFSVGYFTPVCAVTLSGASSDSHQHGGGPEGARISALEDLLASKLAEFLDSSFPSILRQVPSTMKPHLYKGPPSGVDCS